MPRTQARIPPPPQRRQSEEGDGGEDGVVIPLQVTGNGADDIAYVVSLTVGRDNPQSFPVQVDTGSSDLWLVSSTCRSSLCNQSPKYDPSSSTDTGASFSITYLQGSVSGPIVWDSVSLGGYQISNQALAAASSITNEPLSSQFSGILGLALPLNSIIASLIPPVTTNDPDGAAFPSNLFSITPTTLAPSHRFLSLSLSRPGSTQIPAYLGIGKHPSELITNATSEIKWGSVVSDGAGTLFWKAYVRGISVWVDEVEKPVALGRSNNGRPFQSAVLDTGVPLILTTSNVANGIYGAIGIGPADDGQYYVPCDQPLNITITLDDRPPIPIHPLDLTTMPPKDNQSPYCIGLIQPYDQALATPNSVVGDMILGVPFIRNVYTVMQYLGDGVIVGSGASGASGASAGSSSSASSSSSSSSSSASGSSSKPPTTSSKPPTPTPTPSQLDPLTPLLGLKPLTNPIRALSEFHTVRVLNQPIDSTPWPPGSPGANGANGGGGGGVGVGGVGEDGGNGGGRKLSVGILALIGIMAFFGFCFVVFGVRWCFGVGREKGWYGYRYRGVGGEGRGGGEGEGEGGQDGGAVGAVGAGGKKKDGKKKTKMMMYALARRDSHSDEHEEDEVPTHPVNPTNPTNPTHPTNPITRGDDNSGVGGPGMGMMNVGAGTGMMNVGTGTGMMNVGTGMERRLSEDALRTMKFEAYLRNKERNERERRDRVMGSGSTGRTIIGDVGDVGVGAIGGAGAGALGGKDIDNTAGGKDIDNTPGGGIVKPGEFGVLGAIGTIPGTKGGGGGGGGEWDPAKALDWSLSDRDRDRDRERTLVGSRAKVKVKAGVATGVRKVLVRLTLGWTGRMTKGTVG
ncbi:acid protease [Pluteus cervinus]|uniref:Acid protease n=1 Tax=Pluteus cervinus TaxID=181527 RepID=A0ACD3AML0_9AGAR|nr:acid protease [Pluteus cervinus]